MLPVLAKAPALGTLSGLAGPNAMRILVKLAGYDPCLSPLGLPLLLPAPKAPTEPLLLVACDSPARRSVGMAALLFARPSSKSLRVRGGLRPLLLPDLLQTDGQAAASPLPVKLLSQEPVLLKLAVLLLLLPAQRLLTGCTSIGWPAAELQSACARSSRGLGTPLFTAPALAAPVPAAAAPWSGYC
jgi:hypothetical protein